ncbi:copper resistance system multicopper oxidase [Sphingomonas sp. ABOLD]|jgi:CopA family copper-resistance protein|uniref:copper resistance system multicopper oxidase n=1 Tax=Sphingomonas sp. ABOLD TaxID=1985877 RepID=UPI000F7E35AB|nr:copper resistance system multicopper oxidase [Sphingomonas sp. ABOLD]RSV45596.1 copper resistance system multicopper oxidase [Sphingomonas sp. ABOLD]
MPLNEACTDRCDDQFSSGSGSVGRRTFLHGAAALGTLAAFRAMAPSYAWAQPQAAVPMSSGQPEVGPIDLSIGDLPLVINGRRGGAQAINGSIPGPIIRLREGQEAVLRVTNRLRETSSIHWHGIILPPAMDGVPGVSFAGIPPGETFTYSFPVRQSGTYWCHSHSGGQELLGVYAPLIIEPAQPDPFAYDRDYVVMLSDWSFESPATIIGKLKKQAGYYNYQKRTLGDFIRDASNNGFSATLKERLSWSKMRMDPTDFADVTGYTYTYLMNGLPPEANWTGLFRPGERIRLRFIAAGAMTYFDVRIPGLKMTLVQADGQNVRPVEVDEFRIAAGETYDVIVQPEDRAYTVMAEAMDRSGFTRGTLAPRAGMDAPVPPRRKRPLRTMADMGMDMRGMDMGGAAPPAAGMGDMAASGAAEPAGMPGMDMAGGSMQGMEMVDRTRAATADARDAVIAGGMPPGMDMGSMKPTAALAGGLGGSGVPGSSPFVHGPDTHGIGSSSVAMVARSRVNEAGSGFDEPGARVLTYADLRSLAPQPDQRPPAREIELHITGNMERYIWSFDGKKYSEAKTPIAFQYGERLRLVLVNDTMMEHPIHLHGMWMELENGGGPLQPRKHTVSVKPAERLTLAITADAPGRWAMHCHLLLHMELGMFRVVEVSHPTGAAS